MESLTLPPSHASALMAMPLTGEQIKILNQPVLQDVIKKNPHQTGRKEYVESYVYRRILDRAFGKQWSWEIVNYQIRDDQGYAFVHGRLSLPGIGVKDGIGVGKIDSRENSKKDNSGVLTAATTFAFKNACKMAGLVPNVHDGQDWDLEVIEGEFDESGHEDTPDNRREEDDRSDSRTSPPEQPKSTIDFTDKQIARMKELKEAYRIATNAELKPHLEKWSAGAIQSVTQLTGENIDSFIDWFLKNAE